MENATVKITLTEDQLCNLYTSLEYHIEVFGDKMEPKELQTIKEILSEIDRALTQK